MSIWYPGSGMTYTQYLQTNSFVRDIDGHIKKVGKAFESKISEQTRELVAGNQQLARSFKAGFNTLNETLEWGIDRLESSLQNVDVSIQAFHADFNYSMALLLEEVQINNALLSDLLDKLDAIHMTLKSPTLTQAREFYKIGCERLSKGLLDKALEAFLDAEKKNDTDFFTQFQIGKLYLYGIDEDDNVVNLPKAKEHLLLAARYGKAEINIDPSFAQLAAESLLHASISIYAQLGEKNILENSIKFKEMLGEAKKLSLEALKLSPNFSEAHYHSAKYSALLSESDLSISNLEKAIIIDRNYAIKVDLDHAFDLMRFNIFNLISKLREAQKIKCQDLIDQADKGMQILSTWHIEDSSDNLLTSSHQQCKKEQSKAMNLYNSNTYFGYLDSISILSDVVSDASELQLKRMDELRNKIIQTIKNAKDDLPANRECSNKVENLISDAMKLTSKAESMLELKSYDFFIDALSIAAKAVIVSSSAKELSTKEKALKLKIEAERRQAELEIERKKIEEKEKERERQRRQERSSEAYKGYAGCFAILGGLITAFVKFYISLNNDVDVPKNIGDFFQGLLLGAIGGLILAAIVGRIEGYFSKSK